MTQGDDLTAPQLSAKGFPGVLPGDAGIWEALAVAMGVLVAAAFLLTLTLKVVIASVTRRARPAAAGASTEPRTPPALVTRG